MAGTTVLGSGTVTSIINTEITLLTVVTSQNYVVLKIDLSAMLTGDIVQLLVYTKVLPGGTSKPAYPTIFAGAQPSNNLVWFSTPMPSDAEAHFTLKQTAGSPRAYPWSVLAG